MSVLLHESTPDCNTTNLQQLDFSDYSRATRHVITNILFFYTGSDVDNADGVTVYSAASSATGNILADQGFVGMLATRIQSATPGVFVDNFNGGLTMINNRVVGTSVWLKFATPEGSTANVGVQVWGYPINI